MQQQLHRRNRATAKTGKKKRVKFPIFYAIYGTLLVAVFIALYIGLSALSAFLHDYEHALPKYVAEDVFQTYFNPCDFEAVYNIADCDDISAFDGKEGFVRYMKAQTDGKEIAYREVSAGLGDIKKYFVLADSKKFSEFTLRKSGEKNAHNFDLWELDTITPLYKAEKSIKIKALTNSTVYINNLSLTKDHTVSDEIHTEVNKHLPEGVPGISYIVYEVKGLLNEPAAHVLDRFGNESVLTFDEEEGLYTEAINYDAALAQALSAHVIEAAETYAKYLTMDATTTQLRKYFDQTSKIYNYLLTSERYWYTPHISYKFEGSSAAEFYAYTDEVFSCRYTGTMFVYKTASEVFSYKMNLSMYFKKINDTFVVYELINNE